MPYRYLEEIATADVALAAWGKTREELFSACADALANVMVTDIGTIGRDTDIEIRLENDEIDLLLFNFLNEIVFYKDARQLLLRVATVHIADSDGTHLLEASLTGELIDSKKHDLIVDVKAVTLHRLRIDATSQGWEATVVLDI